MSCRAQHFLFYCIQKNLFSPEYHLKNRSQTIRPYNLELQSKNNLHLTSTVWKLDNTTTTESIANENSTNTDNPKTTTIKTEKNSNMNSENTGKTTGTVVKQNHKLKKIDTIRENESVLENLHADIFRICPLGNRRKMPVVKRIMKK